MKLYTKTGDDGTTAVCCGHRVGKDDAIIECIGSIDELNSSLGIASALCDDAEFMDEDSSGFKEVKEVITLLQNDLFNIGSEVVGGEKYADDTQITKLEDCIDLFSSKVEPLRNFILPTGTLLSANLHQARSICRRAERETIRLSLKSDGEKPFNKNIIIYLNRLSDLLFVMARYANKIEHIDDVLWKK